MWGIRRMPAYALAIGLMLTGMLGAAQAQRAVAPEQVLQGWYKLILELVRHTPTYSPPVASRAVAYLGVTATVFACIFAQDTMRRLATLQSAYVFAGVVGTLAGLIGYFKLVPGFELFVLNDRVVSGFKDPNVFGPFLIPPLLWLVASLITDRVKTLQVIWAMIIATGWLLAYSRAAYHGVSNAFLPHSWTLAYVDGAWRSFDLALEEFDSTHIALTVGDGDARSIAAAGQLASLLRLDGLAEVRPRS